MILITSISDLNIFFHKRSEAKSSVSKTRITVSIKQRQAFTHITSLVGLVIDKLRKIYSCRIDKLLM